MSSCASEHTHGSVAGDVAAEACDSATEHVVKHDEKEEDARSPPHARAMKDERDDMCNIRNRRAE